MIRIYAAIIVDPYHFSLVRNATAFALGFPPPL